MEEFTIGDPFSGDAQGRQAVFAAAADFYRFQNFGYPRKSALEWVGNRHGLNAADRQLLHRGVFSRERALMRLGKRCRGASWRSEPVVVDGHNVHITLESALLGRPLVRANDGALRDTAGLSARFRVTDATEAAVALLFHCLKAFSPREVVFLFDAPMSHSGILAACYREALASFGIPGEARTARVPEREFPYEQAVVAGSDRAVLDQARRWLDLASLALGFARCPHVCVDFFAFLAPRT